MSTEDGDVVISLQARYRIIPLPNGRLRGIKTGDRFNITASGQYFPGCAASVVPDHPTEGSVLLRVIARRSLTGLFNGRIELREGPDAFALCDISSVLSIE